MPGVSQPARGHPDYILVQDRSHPRRFMNRRGLKPPSTILISHPEDFLYPPVMLKPFQAATLLVLFVLCVSVGAQQPSPKFHLQEATIAGIQRAIQSRQITTTDLVQLYLKRIKAYNNTCVNEPMGILGPITTIPHARQINALSTLNLRPATRKAWGFDDRKARSMTDAADIAPNMPDALEVAAAQDRQFRQTGRLVGPLHGVVMAIKDQYDTFDLRTTSGADVQYANDRPPQDATFVKRLRDAGAIIVAKANLAEYA